MRIPIQNIRLDGDTQPRVSLDQNLVNEYAEAMRDGASFPPITVFREPSGVCWLADGFHRVYAARQAGECEIDADVRQGTVCDAQRFSLSANATHGARRTNADKRRAVELAFKILLSEGRSLEGITNTEVAGMAAVSEITVRRWHEEIASAMGTTSTKSNAPEITNPDLTVTAKLKDEIDALRRTAEAERARAGKNEVLLKNAREQEEKAKSALDRVRAMHEDAQAKYREALEDLETHKRELRRLQAAPPKVAERVVEVVKEVPVVPPEVQERIAALEKERDQLAGHIDKAKAERRDIDDLLRRKVEIQKALKDLQGQQSEEQTLRQYQTEMALAVREVRLCLEKNKGAVERLSKEGLPSDAWDARVILNTAALCREVGDLLDVAVQTISVRGMTPTGEEVTVHVERP